MFADELLYETIFADLKAMIAKINKKLDELGGK